MHLEDANPHRYVYPPAAIDYVSRVIAASSTIVLSTFSETTQDAHWLSGFRQK